MIFGAKFSCKQPAISVVSFVGANLLQDSNDKPHAFFDNKFSRDADNLMRHDMIHIWKHGHIPPHNCFGLLYLRNPVLPCVVQDRFHVHSMSRTTFLQEGGNDEDMTKKTRAGPFKVPVGPVTRARAKRFKDDLQNLIIKLQHDEMDVCAKEAIQEDQQLRLVHVIRAEVEEP